MLEFILAVIAPVIPGAALVVDLSFRRRQAEAEAANKRLEEARYNHDQEVQATERLTAWASRSSVLLALADHLLNSPDSSDSDRDFDREKRELAAQISGLVDEGRWLFPNHHPDAYGSEKAKVNRGYRDSRLDPLVKTYKKLMGEMAVEPSSERKDFAWKIQDLSLPLSKQVTQGEK